MEQEKEIINLETILNQEIVLVDTSFFHDSSNLAWNTYEDNFYNHIDINLINSYIEDLNQSLSILRNPNIRTIPQVTEEVKKLQNHIREKINDLKRKQPYSVTRHTKKGERKDYQRINKVKSKIAFLQDRVFKTINLLKKSELDFKDKRYKLLSEMVFLISKSIRLKKDCSYREGEKLKDPYDSDTDEKLTAALFYLSIFSGTSASLLTRDTDFVSLIRVIPPIIGAYSLPQPSNKLRIALQTNPATIYLRRSNTYEKYEKMTDTLSIIYPQFPKIHKLNYQQNKEVQKKLKELWEEI